MVSVFLANQTHPFLFSFEGNPVVIPFYLALRPENQKGKQVDYAKNEGG
jgi:hypothetical protein